MSERARPERVRPGTDSPADTLNRETDPAGRSLYRPVSIGNLHLAGNVFLAPVAGYSDRAFRSLCIDCGADFTYTEMVSSEALTRNSGKTESLMLRAPNEERYAVQIFGGDPERMGEAAFIALSQTGAECLDINAGCPVPKIVKTGAGSALTRDPDRLALVTRAVIRGARRFSEETGSVPAAVTVKIRSGWDASDLSWERAARAALDEGAQAITLHPRTRAQGYEGKSDWSVLAALSALARRDYPGIPVFGSGDLFAPEDAERMLSETGCDGVMFARGAMGNPFIFTQTRELLTSGSYADIPAETRVRAGWKELLDLVSDSGEEAACREMRKRFCAYTKGIEGGAALRAEIVLAETAEDYRKIIETRGFSLFDR